MSLQNNQHLPYFCHLLFSSDTSVLNIKVQFHRQRFVSEFEKKVTLFASLPSAAHSKRLFTYFSLQEWKNIGYVDFISYQCWAMFIFNIPITSKIKSKYFMMYVFFLNNKLRLSFFYNAQAQLATKHTPIQITQWLTSCVFKHLLYWWIICYRQKVIFSTVINVYLD